MFSFLAFGGTLAGGNPTLYGHVKNQNAWVDVFDLDCSQEILRNIGYLQGRKKEEIQKQYYLNSENKYEKSVLQNEKTEQEEELREAYIRFVSKQKNGFFDEDLYNIVNRGKTIQKKDDENEFLGGSYETKRTLRKSMARNSTQFP